MTPLEIFIPGEEWRDVPGFEGRYQVSSIGRIKSLARQEPAVSHGKPGVRRISERILSLKKMPNRALRVCLGAGREFYVHRLVAAAFIGPAPDGAQVCHYDGNPANNCLPNLRYDTQSGNERDKKRHGTDAAGERNPGAKITAADVIWIRQNRKKIRGYVMAQRLNIAQSTVSMIARGKLWQHIGDSNEVP